MNIKCPYQKTVLVTGASSGIGKETADLFAMNGFIVYAASRHPKSTSNPNIMPASRMNDSVASQSTPPFTHFSRPRRSITRPSNMR